MRYVYFDASFREGRAHLGVIVTDVKIKNNKVFGAAVKYTRVTTAKDSFEAELKAFQFAARIAEQIGVTTPMYFSDNQGLVYLINKCKAVLKNIQKNRSLIPLAPSIFPFFPRKGVFEIHWIPRELNYQADRLTK